eukprot:COSAG05_NODE_16534_length_344_cov_0.620408_1_plen_65_part_10
MIAAQIHKKLDKRLVSMMNTFDAEESLALQDVRFRTSRTLNAFVTPAWAARLRENLKVRAESFLI